MRIRTRWRRMWPLLLALAMTTGCTSGLAPVEVSVRPSTPPPPPQPVTGQPREIVVGVDDLSGGFNPHTLADRTPVGAAVADLVYPSAFEPVGGGEWRLNTRLLVSALVTGRDPFTVVYRIRDDAAWSDGAPIAAEDFAYLAEQMRSQPGVVAAAGYELIDRVVAAEGGKTVKVIFSEPYPAWRSLFQHLLPAHLLKDAPGGWDNALDSEIPVSGGPFRLVAVDPARNQILLRRNDRYWAEPAWADRLVLRKLPPQDLLDALHSGGVDVALFTSPESVAVARAAGKDLPKPDVLARPVLTRLVLRPAGGQLAVRDMRAAVAAALDRDSLLAAAGFTGSAAGLVANAQVLAPSQPGYRPTLPSGNPLTGDGTAPAERLLTELGYRRVPEGWSRDGGLLTLQVAAPVEHVPYPRLARRVAGQLRAIGIRATVHLMPGDELVAALAGEGVVTSGGSRQSSTQRAASGIDIAVLPQPVGTDPATVLASVHCPVDTFSRRGQTSAGLAGFCTPSLAAQTEAALTGDRPVDDVLDTIRPALWQRLISIPLYQPTTLRIARPALAGADSGALLKGPLHDAAQWHLDQPQ